MPQHTPWGAAQDQKRIAAGITSYSTASHGGYHLSTEVLAQMPTALAAIRTYAGAGWYEEDCDWAIVALAFPQHFSDYNLYGAVATVLLCGEREKDPYMAEAAAWLRTDPVGIALHNRVKAWIAAHGTDFTQGGASSGGKGWGVSCTNIAGTERLEVFFPEGSSRYDWATRKATGYYALPAHFPAALIEQLGGQIVKRAPIAEPVAA